MKPEIQQINVFGSPIKPCNENLATGFFRDGFCHINQTDYGMHGVCALMSDEFLAFSKQHGNDLITPRPEYLFPGLLAGDVWCLCIDRWMEALVHGVAPKLILESCHVQLLNRISLEQLREHEATNPDNTL